MVASVWSPQASTVTQANATGTVKQELVTATTGQRVFNLLTFAYFPNTGSLNVFKNGRILIAGRDYVESSNTSITLSVGATLGDEIYLQGFVGITGVVGVDSVLRAQLLGASGSAQVSYKSPATGAILHSVERVLREKVSAFNFMTEAQCDDVTASTALIDVTVALQAALDYCAITRQELELPAGRYRISASLKVKEFAYIRGQGRHFTILSGIEAGMTTPVLVNDSATFFGYTSFAKFGIEGGRNCIRLTVTGETAYCYFEDILLNNSTEATFYCNRLLQTSTFLRCRFNLGNYGIDTGYTSNMNNFIDCEFANQAYSAIRFTNSEVNNFFGCNFGSAGVVGRTCIDVADSRNLNFWGCYFENTHDILLNEVTSSNSVSFNYCHFTAAITGAVKFRFISNGRVNFGHNNWYLPSDGAQWMMITGPNAGLGSPASRIDTIDAYGTMRINSGTITYPGAQKDLIKVTCNPQDNNPGTMGSMTGVLTINYQSINAGGFNQVYISRKYLVRVSSSVGGTLVGAISQVTTAASLDVLNGSTFTPQVKAGATPFLLTIEGLFTGNATPVGSSFSWAFESNSGANAATTIPIPAIA